MLPHDPDIATSHHDPIHPGEGGKDDLPVTDRRPVRAWLAVLAIVLAAGAVTAYWWFVVAAEDDETNTGGRGIAISTR